MLINLPFVPINTISKMIIKSIQYPYEYSVSLVSARVGNAQYAENV